MPKLIHKLLLLLAGSILTLQMSSASAMTRADPAELGFDTATLDELRGQLDQLVREGSAPGISVMVARKGQVAFEHVVGTLDVETGAPLKADSLFRIYSMTKPVTAFAALQLVDQGLIGADTPVTSVLPEWKDLTAMDGESEVPAQPMLLSHLLTHTSGLSYGYYGDTKVDRMYRAAGIIDDWDYLTHDLDELAAKLADIPLLFQPGSRWHYGFSSDVAGLVVERVSKLKLDEYMHERVFKPLGVEDAYFDVPPEALNRFGTNQYRKPDGGWRIQDTPREDPEFIDVSFLSGGGGLVMTTEAFTRWAVMIANGGKYGDIQLLSEDTTKLMFTNQLPDAARAAGSNPHSFGLSISPRMTEGVATGLTYSWGGAAGTRFWIDLQHELVVVVMVQVLNSTGREVRTVREHVYRALEGNKSIP